MTHQTVLIADSGSTKTQWCLSKKGKKHHFVTSGLNPYFLTDQQLVELLLVELMPRLKNSIPQHIYFYGAGCGDKTNAARLQKIIKKLTAAKKVQVQTDIYGAAFSLCGADKGIVSILGTGSNSCSFNGKKITQNNPALGFILGDEGSGSYLGKMVLQHHLYNIFDSDLQDRFNQKYALTRSAVLENTYRGSTPNKYLGQFAQFLSENRGHYMIENILEDGINDFFHRHLTRYQGSWKYPIHFTGSVAYAFRDVLATLCNQYGFELGNVSQNPMIGLTKRILKK